MVGWMPPESYAARLGLSYRFFGRRYNPRYKAVPLIDGSPAVRGIFFRGIIGERKSLDQIVEIAAELLSANPAPNSRQSVSVGRCRSRDRPSSRRSPPLYSPMASAIASERSAAVPRTGRRRAS